MILVVGLATYLLHSSIWFAAAWLVQSLPCMSSRTKVATWEFAALGGMLSCILIHTPLAEPITAAVGFEPLLVDGTASAHDAGAPAAIMSWPVIVLTLWAFGSSVLVTRWSVHMHRLVVVLRRRVAIDNDRLVTLANDVARRMGMRGSICVSTSDELTSPVALGWREVCMPRRLLADLRFEQDTLRAIIGHELSHLRRGDPIRLPAFRLLSALLWPQPLWFVFQRHRDREVEHVCDQAGARVVGNPRTMAASLVRVASWLGPQPAGLAALQPARGELSSRVSQLLSPSTALTGRTERIGMYLIPIAMLALTFATPPLVASSNDTDPSAEFDGTIDKDQVRNVVRANIEGVTACYNAALTQNKSIAGRIVVGFTIVADGSVSSSSVESSTLNDVQLDACIVGHIAGLKFPEPRGGGKVKVSYPFKLST